MNYIDLSLKPHNSEDQNLYTLNQIINDNKIIIILGSPGSGKTSVLKKYQQENENLAEFLSIQKFIKYPESVNKSKNILLLDGLDEYRSISSSDKSFVVTELGIQVNKLIKEFKIVVTCREMDWYGELDVKALKDEINHDVSVYKLCPLDYPQQLEFAELWKVNEVETLMKKFANTGFLSNPQMFHMIAELYNQDNKYIVQKKKKDIYFDFIKNAKEKNQTRIINKTNRLDNDEVIKYLGYIAFYYFFSDVQIFNSEFIDEISSDENGYPREKLEIVINTNLFDENQFIHRTIAEFSCAWYIFEYRRRTNFISLERIKSIFIIKNRIPTELRGVYAWLCSFTGNKELIEIDPFYQVIHGDNSGFSLEDKKNIILAVKEYSKENPYFINYSDRTEIESFYTIEIDDFLIKEYEEALKLENHYIYFLNSIVTSVDVIGFSLKEYIKNFILRSDIKNYYKRGVIKSLFSDSDFLKLTLDTISSGEIEDNDDSLKEEILFLLYPEIITPGKIIDYLCYHNETIGHCYYLYKTKFEDKYELVDKILSRCKPEKEYDQLEMPENAESFVEDYFMEVILYYKEKYTAKDIYEILKHFKSYFGYDQNINFRTYRYNLSDKQKLKTNQLIQLSNELFSLYLDDILSEEKYSLVYINYAYFTGFQKPTAKKEILISKLNKDMEKNKIFFLLTLIYHETDEGNRKKELLELAKTYEVEDKVQEWLNPQKDEYEIEFEKSQLDREEKQRKHIEKNEAYLKKKTDDEILNCFGDLNYTSNLLFIDASNEYKNHVTKGTFNRLKSILKQLLLHNLIEPKLSTIDSLAKDSPDVRRNMDRVYYVTCCLNDDEIYNKIENTNFLKYLYIVSVSFDWISNIIKGSFINWIENKKRELAIEALVEFSTSLFRHYLPDLKSKPFEKEKDIEKLKKLSRLYLSDKRNIENNLIYNFLKEYNFQIDNDVLESLLIDEVADKENKELILAFLTFNKEKKEDFTINMAVDLYEVIEGDRFQKDLSVLGNEKKIRFIHYSFNVFNTEKLIEHHDGTQSAIMICASFLRSEVLNTLTVDDLLELKYLHSDDTDIWKKLILNKISEKEQNDVDILKERFSIEKAKNFILKKDIINYLDFFNELIRMIQEIKDDIESNRDNQRDAFFNSDKTSRDEEYCRDRIKEKLVDRYGYTLDCSREKLEGNNRVDINVRYKTNLNYEIQIECKKDNNREIYPGVNAQLIEKYFKKSVLYGIYLIFYFGDKKDRNLMLRKIHENIPGKYSDKVKVIIIDLV